MKKIQQGKLYGQTNMSLIGFVIKITAKLTLEIAAWIFDSAKFNPRKLLIGNCSKDAVFQVEDSRLQLINSKRKTVLSFS